MSGARRITVCPEIVRDNKRLMNMTRPFNPRPGKGRSYFVIDSKTQQRAAQQVLNAIHEEAMERKGDN